MTVVKEYLHNGSKSVISNSNVKAIEQLSETIIVKRWKDPGSIIACLLLIIGSSIAFVRQIADGTASLWDLGHPIFVLLMFYVLIQILFGYAKFIVSESYLTIISGYPLVKHIQQYKIDQISGLGPEYDIPSKAPFGIGYGDVPIFSHKYNAVTFDYHEKRVMLGLDLQAFDMQRLVDMISKNNSEILEGIETQTA